MKVEIYSDVACPWCYIGKQRFERALASYAGDEPVEVVYRPFQLDPGAPAPGVPMRQYLERRFGPRAAGMADQVVSAGRGEGLALDYDRGVAANTLDAHRLLLLAEREHGAAVQRGVAEALFRAHFAEGVDISDRDVLVELSQAAGMDGERVRAYLASPEGSEEVRSEIAQAQRLGIAAVPTFVFEGRYAVQGAQPASAFVDALETVARESSAAAAEGDACGSGDGCGDGVCSV